MPLDGLGGIRIYIYLNSNNYTFPFLYTCVSQTASCSQLLTCAYAQGASTRARNDAAAMPLLTCAYAQGVSAKPYKILTCALCILVAGISPGWIILSDLPYRVLHLCKPPDVLLGLRTPSRPIFGANLLRIFCSLWVRTLS